MRLSYSSPGGGSRFAIIARALAGHSQAPQLEGEVQRTGSFDEFKSFEVGELKLDQGRARIEVRAREVSGALWNLRSVELLPVTR